MFKRILMNAADTSGGNGANPPVEAPVEPQAQGAPDTSALESIVTSLATQLETLTKSVNSLHAADRRSREGKPQPKNETPTNGTNPTADDPSSLLALRDAFDDATSELKLTKGQRQLLREAVMGKRLDPGDVDGFVADYVSRAGWGQSTNATQPAAQLAAQHTAPPQPQNAIPASDRGAPPPPRVPLAEADLMSMSEADRRALLKEKGPVWYRNQLAAQLKGRPIAVRR